MTFNPGQLVKFKPASTWHIAFGETTLEVVGNLKDTDGRTLPTMYQLKCDTHPEVFAHVDELELVLPEIVTAGIASGVGDWWQAIQPPTETVGFGVDMGQLVLSAISSAPKPLISTPEPTQPGEIATIVEAPVTTSWTDDLLASVGSTISNVHESTAGVLSSVDIGAVCESVGDTIGSVAGGLGDAACAVGEGLGSVASGVGEAIGGIADAL